MKKRILASILSACALFTLSTSPVMAADKDSFVAIGDSISTGYGLEGYSNTPTPNAKDSFVNKVSEVLGATAINFAVDGATSVQLMDALASADDAQKAAIASAKVISMTIGGNDLIGGLLAPVGKQMGSEKTEDIMKAIMGAAGGNADLTAKLNAALKEAIGSLKDIAFIFSANLTNIITSLRMMNPTATILVQTIANPYVGIPNDDLVAAVDKGVGALNSVITAGAATGAYTVVDVYTAFKGAKAVLTNAVNPATPLDPHPNKSGHELIAKIIYDLLPHPTLLPAANTNTNTDTSTNPQTGDNTPIGAVTALLATGIFLLMAGIMQKRKVCK